MNSKTILKPVPSSSRQVEVNKSVAEGGARNYKSFAKDMKLYLPEMRTGQRNALLTELYRLSNVKKLLESYLERERKGANIATVCRKYRLWLVKVETQLRKAIQEMNDVANVENSYPKREELEKIDLEKDDLDRNELETLVVGKTMNAIVRARTNLLKVIEDVKYRQYLLAAVIHPNKRTEVEKKLAPREPKGLRHNLLISRGTTQIDHEFIRQAASTLRKYRNKDGKTIPRDLIIAAVFKVAFGDMMRTEGSISKSLQPSRRKPLP